MSGIYIPGVEKTKTCAFCRFCDGLADTQLGACAFCVVDGKAREADITPKDCPLIPVPDHGRMIDADAFKKRMMQGAIDAREDALTDEIWLRILDAAKSLCLDIDEQPTIIPAEEGQ